MNEIEKFRTDVWISWGKKIINKSILKRSYADHHALQILPSSCHELQLFDQLFKTNLGNVFWHIILALKTDPIKSMKMKDYILKEKQTWEKIRSGRYLLHHCQVC